MFATKRSRHSHGRSEVWERPGLARTVQQELRHLGDRLRRLRQERHLTQEQAAEQIGVHPKTLQRMEQGKANVTVATLVAAAAAFRLPLDALFHPEP